MGKKLIIKGADFSANRLKVEEWYYYMGNSSVNSSALSTYAPLSLSDDNMSLVVGHLVNKIKIYCNSNGTMTIGKLSSTGIITNLQSYSVSAGYNLLTLTTPIIFMSGEKITFTGVSLGACTSSGLDINHTPGIKQGYSYTTDKAYPCGVTGGNVYIIADIGYIN